MHWRGGCIAREGAHATPCCSVLALVRVRSAGCPARESVAACRGRSCRLFQPHAWACVCGPAADRTPALQYGRTSLHNASISGHAAVVQTLLENGANVAATDEVGAAGVGVAVCARVPACHVCARHGMHGDVCTQSCASVWLFLGSSVRRGRARDGDGPHMHARSRHAPADTPARFRTAKPLSTGPKTAVMRSRRRRSRQRCASTEPSIRSFMRLRWAWSSCWRT